MQIVFISSLQDSTEFSHHYPDWILAIINMNKRNLQIYSCITSGMENYLVISGSFYLPVSFHIIKCIMVYAFFLNDLEEEISAMRKELDKYGIQMPAFSKIGGILANEVK